MPHTEEHKLFRSRFNPLGGTGAPPGTAGGGLGQFRGASKGEIPKPDGPDDKPIEADTGSLLFRPGKSKSDFEAEGGVLGAFTRGLEGTATARLLEKLERGERKAGRLLGRAAETILQPTPRGRAGAKLFQTGVGRTHTTEEISLTEGTPYVETDSERAIREAREAGMGPNEIALFDLAGHLTKEAVKIAVAAKLGRSPGADLLPTIGKMSPKLAAAGRSLLLRSPKLARAIEGAVQLAPEGTVFGVLEEYDEHGEVSGADSGFRIAFTTAIVALLGAGVGALGAKAAAKSGGIKVGRETAELALKKINSKARIVPDEDGVLIVRFPNGEEAGVSDLILEGAFKDVPNSPLYEGFPFRTPELAAEAEAQLARRQAVRVTPDQHPLVRVEPPLVDPTTPPPTTTRVRSGADVGRAPKQLPPGPKEPSPVEPKVRRTFIDDHVYETVEYPGSGGVMLRDGEVAGVIPSNKPNLVVAREMKNEGEILSQVELAFNKLYKGGVELEPPAVRRVLGNTDEQVRAGIAKAKVDGGFTFNRDGSSFSDPGFVVTVASKNVAPKDLTVGAVRDFAAEHGEQIAKRNLKVGLFEMEGGKYSIDLNVVMANRNDALALGRKMGQKSIWDNTTKKVIETGGTGAARKVPPAQLERELSDLGDFMSLEHFSPAPRETISPRFAGSGPVKGAERKRGGVPKVFFNRAGKMPEPGLGNYQHEVSGRFKVYDVLKDPLGIIEKTRKSMKAPKVTDEVFDEAERAIQEAGFEGVENTGRGVVALFRDVTPDRVTRVDLVALRGERRLQAAAERSTPLLRQEQGAATLPPGFAEPGEPPRGAGEIADKIHERATRVRVAEKMEEGMVGKGGGADQGPAAAADEASRALGQHMVMVASNNRITARVFRAYLQRAVTMAKRDLGWAGQEWARRIELVRAKSLMRKGRLMEGGLDAEGKEFPGASQIMSRYTDDQLKDAVRVNRGLIPREGASKESLAAEEELRPIFDDIADAYQASGGTRTMPDGSVVPFEKSGEFFPTMLNRVGREITEVAQLNVTDPAVKTAARRMSETMGMSEDDAAVILANFRKKRLIQNNGYLTQTREPIPEFMLELNPRVYVEDFLERQTMWLEGHLEFGAEQRGATKLFEAMRDVDPGLTDALELHHAIQFGGKDRTPEAVRTMFGGLSNVMTISKLGHPFVTIKQVGQRIINTSDLPFSQVLRTYKDMPHDIFIKLAGTRKMRAKLRARKEKLALEARQSGAVQTRFTAIQDIEEASPMQALIRGGVVNVPRRLGGGEITLRRGALDVFGFLPGEKGNQEFTAIAAKRSLEFLLKRHAELTARDTGTDSPMGKMFNAIQDLARDGVIPIWGRGGSLGKVDRTLQRMIDDDAHMASIIDRWSKLERITPDEYKAVMIKANQDRNFPLDIMTKPVFWDSNPVFRLALKFKPFIAKQTAFLWKHVYKEAALGNVGPFLRAFTGAMFMGEALNIPRDLVMGRSGSITMKLIKDPESLDSPEEIARQILSHNADAATFGIFSDMVWGWDNFVGGVMVSTGKHLGLAFRDINNRIGKPGFFKQVQAVSNELARKEFPIYKQAEGFRNKVDSVFRENNYHPDWARIRDKAFAFDEQFELSPGGEVRQLASDALGARSEGFKRNETTLLYRYAWENVTLGDRGDAAEYIQAIYEDKGLEEAEAGIVSSMRSAAPLGPLSTSKKWMDSPKVQAFLDGLSDEEYFRVIDLQERFIEDAQLAIDLAFERAQKKAGK